ncbi:MAG: hypothetical protein AB7I18_02660 [Candidatus Berkiella sp.]
MRPEDILPDDQNTIVQGGKELRKGSVAAFMANVRILQNDALKAEQATAKAHLMELMPTMEALGFFELFDIRDEKIKRLIAR